MMLSEIAIFGIVCMLLLEISSILSRFPEKIIVAIISYALLIVNITLIKL